MFVDKLRDDGVHAGAREPLRELGDTETVGCRDALLEEVAAQLLEVTDEEKVSRLGGQSIKR